MRLAKAASALAVLAVAYVFAPSRGATAPSMVPPSRAVFLVQHAQSASVLVVGPVERSVFATISLDGAIGASTVAAEPGNPRVIVAGAHDFTELDLDGTERKTLYRCPEGFTPLGAAYGDDGSPVLWCGSGERLRVARVRNGDIETAQVDFGRLLGMQLAQYGWVSPWTLQTLMFVGADHDSAYFVNSVPLPWHWEKRDLSVWRADFVGGTVREQRRVQPWPDALPLNAGTGELMRLWGLPKVTANGAELVPVGESRGLALPRFGREVLFEVGGERYLEMLRTTPHSLTVVERDLTSGMERLAYEETQHALAVPLGVLPGDVFAYTFTDSGHEQPQVKEVELHLRDVGTGRDTVTVSAPAPARITYLGAF